MKPVSKKPELLAPAGDLEKLKLAFAYGADAVYAGLPMFSLRTRENQFDLESVRQAIEYTHALGKKIYITANIYAHNQKIDPFLEAMDQVIPLNADGYIMSDPGLIDFVRGRYTDAEVHLSTQANNTNWAQVRFWKKLGLKRIILARELCISEIQEIISRNPDIETEVFVHGAMCISYSGRCLLSDYLTGRPSNSGACTQACRWSFQGVLPDSLLLEESRRPKEFLSLEEDAHGSYLFYSKDLCALEHLPEIIQTGVHSLKLEGRNKNFLYLATVVRVYRQAIDAFFEGTFFEKKPQWKTELESINHRGYTEGFFTGRLSNTVNYTKADFATRKYLGKPLNVFSESNGTSWVELDIKNKLSVGDSVEWMSPQGILSETIKAIRVPTSKESWRSVESISAGNATHPQVLTQCSVSEYSLLRSSETPTSCADSSSV